MSPPRSGPSSRDARSQRETTHPRARPAGHGSRSRRGFPSRCSPCFGPNDMRRCGHCSMARSRWRGRPGTASGLPEAWPATRLARAALWRSRRCRGRRPDRPCGDRAPAPAIYRVMNAGLLIKTQVLQGELDAAERTLAPLELKQRGIAHRRNSSLRTRQAADRTETLGRRPRGLPGRRGRPDPSVCDLSRCPPLAVGGRARRSCARRSGGGRTPRRRGARARPGVRSPRALGVAKRAAGVVAGGDRGKSPLREAVDDLECGGARLERARSCGPRRPASAAQPPHRSPSAPARSA